MSVAHTSAVTSDGLLRRRTDVIFIIDDEVAVRGFIAECLFSAGFRAVAVGHGFGVVERVILADPLAIILDLEMPGLDGLAVLETLKSDGRTRHIPVVMFSGSLQRGWQTAAQRNGCAVCLDKPTSPDLLIATVRNTVNPSCSLSP